MPDLKTPPLIWIDCEMTGLNPDHDTILEVACIITDSTLSIIAKSPNIIIRQPSEILEKMDEWNQQHHKASGLYESSLKSTIDLSTAEMTLLEFITQTVASGISPMCGNTIAQDRAFLKKYMPKLESVFHYRNLDVSTIKELVKRWRPDLSEKFIKKNTHRALEDIEESIEELRFYKENFFFIP
jgi:oligoribonuclease